MRKSHRKSRKGCVQCKQRHIKCTETRPECGNCERLEIACSFSCTSPRPDLSSSSVHHSATTPISTPPVLSNATQPLSLLDLEIYHHMVYEQSATLIANNVIRDKLWRNLLELGFSKPFVLYNCMALSALHLFQAQSSRTELFERACYLQGVAIQQAHPVIANMTQDDSLGALVFSSRTAAFGLAEFMLNPHYLDEPVDPIDKIVECFQLSRGVELVISQHWEYLSGTWALSLTPDTREKEDEARKNIETDWPMYQSVRALAFGQDDPDRRQACLKEAEDLFTFLSVVRKHEEIYQYTFHFIDTWAIRMSTEFRTMLAERKPVALIILAYYTVLMVSGPPIRVWHLRGWPESLINRIDSILGPEWAEFLRWPKENILENTHQMQNTPAATPGSHFNGSTSDSQTPVLHEHGSLARPHGLTTPGT